MKRTRAYSGKRKRGSGKLISGRITTIRRKKQYNRVSYQIKPEGKHSYQSASAYAKTLIDPWNFRGIRIPDLSCAPTAVWSEELELPLVLSNDSVIKLDLSATSIVHFGIADVTPLTAANHKWTSTPQPITNLNSNAQRYSSGRVVSAMLSLTFTGASTVDEGQILGLQWVPSDKMATSYNSAVTDKIISFANPWVADFTAAMTLPNAYVGAANRGICITYKPVDGTAFEMTPTVTGAGSPLTTFGTAQPKYGGFFVWLSGITTNSPYILKVIVNYEGIALSGSDIPAAVSTANQAAVDYAFNVVGAVTEVGPVSDCKKKQAIARSVGH